MTATGRWVALAAFAVLAANVAPGLYLRDSGELTTAAFTLGVAHETGFSLFCLLAKLATLVPLGEVATRVNLASAALGALAAGWVFGLVRALVGGDRTAEVAGVAAAALLVAGLTFWKACTVAEVYASTAAAMALALLLAERAAHGARGAALCLALVGGLSLGLHAQLRLLVGPPCIAWALWRLRRGDRWPLLGPLALALGAAVVAYLPLRAARAPAANWADPQTIRGVLSHLGAARIRGAFADQILTHDLGALVDRLRAFFALVEGQLGLPALLVGAAGVAWLWRRARLVGLLVTFILVGDALYAAWINPMGLDDLQDGAPTALALAVAVGAGVCAAARRFGRAAPWAAGALGVLVVVPALLDELDAKTGLGSEATVWAAAALDAAPPRALVLTASDDLSAGTLYEQAVAGARPDVTALVRQQLWDRVQVAARLARAGGEVRPVAVDDLAQPEIVRRLVERELPARAVLWEPHDDLPGPFPLEPGVPLYRVGRIGRAGRVGLDGSGAALPPARPLALRVEALLQPGRDPFVRQLSATMLTALGRTWLARGDEPRAVALFDAALGVSPGDPAAATNLAVVRARRGDYAGALALVDNVVARSPDRLVARVNAARYRLALGDLDGAERGFGAARRRAPRDPGPLVGLARVAQRRGDRTRAQALAASALRLAPGDPEATRLSGEVGY